jgi:hypothetical protein
VHADAVPVDIAVPTYMRASAGMRRASAYMRCTTACVGALACRGGCAGAAAACGMCRHKVACKAAFFV